MKRSLIVAVVFLVIASVFSCWIKSFGTKENKQPLPEIHLLTYAEASWDGGMVQLDDKSATAVIPLLASCDEPSAAEMGKIGVMLGYLNARWQPTKITVTQKDIEMQRTKKNKVKCREFRFGRE